MTRDQLIEDMEKAKKQGKVRAQAKHVLKVNTLKSMVTGSSGLEVSICESDAGMVIRGNSHAINHDNLPDEEVLSEDLDHEYESHGKAASLNDSPV